jgi:hypothetical protein
LKDKKEVPKDRIVELEKIIFDLGQYDRIIPQIMADLVNKAAEYARGVLKHYQDFRQKC